MEPHHYYHPLYMSITKLEVAGWRQIGNQEGLDKRRKLSGIGKMMQIDETLKGTRALVEYLNE
jgi:hypothetical protein